MRENDFYLIKYQLRFWILAGLVKVYNLETTLSTEQEALCDNINSLLNILILLWD